MKYAIVLMVGLILCRLYIPVGMDYTNLTVYEAPYPDIAIDLTHLGYMGNTNYNEKAKRSF